MPVNPRLKNTSKSLWPILSALVVCVCVSVSWATHMEKANAFFTDGKMHAAIAEYRKAADAGENPSLAWFNAANAWFQIDSLPQSIVCYRSCLAYSPDFLKGWLNISVVYYNLDDMGACIASVNQVLRLEPTHQKALLIKAAACRRAGAISEAIPLFERIIELYPGLEDPYIALAEMYRELDDVESSVSWLNAFPPEGANIGYVNLLLADLFEKEGDLTRAFHHVELAFAADKTREWVYYRKAELQQRMGNDLLALEMAKDGMSMFPKFPDIAVFAATAAYVLRRYDEALFCYEHARTLGSAAAVAGIENVRLAQQHRTDAAGLPSE